jgi:hypothetical protein
MKLDDATIASRLVLSLPKARWFADKGGGIAGVELVERLPLPGDGTDAMALVDVRLAGGDRSARYAVMLDHVGNDATATPTVGRWLLDLVLSGGSLPGRRGRFVGHTTRAASVVPTGPLTASTIGGDASNTSLVVHELDNQAVSPLSGRHPAGG